MSNDTETARYYVRGTDPTNDEQIAFECVGLAVANAKAAELRMGGYRDVILSLAKASEADDPQRAEARLLVRFGQLKDSENVRPASCRWRSLGPRRILLIAQH